MAKAPINIKIEGDYSDRDIKRAQRDLESLKRNSQQTTQKFGAMSRGMKFAGAAIAAAAAGAAFGVTRFAAQSVGAASDLDESLSKTRTVFGDASAAVEKFAQDAATNLGLSTQAALEATSTFGNLFTAMGINQGKASALSQEIVQLAADLASFNNIEVEEAIIALRSGLVGETEPLRRLGVNLSAARINAEALSSGLAETKGQIDAAAKAQAAFNLIMDDTATAQGDFARTSDGLANTTRTLKAAVDDAKASIGVGFVNAILAVTDAAGGPQGAADSIRSLGDQIGLFIEGVALAGKQTGTFSLDLGSAEKGIDSAADAFEDAGGGVFGFAEAVRSAIGGGSGSSIGVLITAFQAQAEAARRAEAATEAMARVMRGSVKPADHLSSSLSVLRGQTDAAAAAAARFTAETGTQLFQVQAANKYYRDAGVRLKRLADDEEAAAEAADKLGRSAGSAGSAVNSLADRIEDARGRAIEGIKNTRAGLKEELEKAQADFDNFSLNVQNAIMGALNFEAAAPEFDEQGNLVGGTFLDGLKAQAERAQEFAQLLSHNLIQSLSPEAFAEVFTVSTAKGIAIMEELIAGGQGAIDETNDLVDATKAAAEKVAEQSALTFKQTGITEAHALLEGFHEQMGPGGEGRKELMKIMDDLAKKAARTVKINVKITENINRFVREINTSITPKALGGPVDAGSPFLVGERGPELFVPNISGMIVPNNELRPSGGNVINLTVNAGMGTDSRQVSKQIVDALKHYQRSNGPLPLKVAG